jgi:hypothetical protein
MVRQTQLPLKTNLTGSQSPLFFLKGLDMAMQYDVKSKHASTSGLLFSGRTRLKGAVCFPLTGTTGYAAFVDNVSVTGTYARSTTTATITATNHGLSVGDWVYLDWDLTDNPYQVQTVADANTFTVTVTNTGNTSGAVIVYNDVLLQADASDPCSIQYCCARRRHLGPQRA